LHKQANIWAIGPELAESQYLAIIPHGAFMISLGHRFYHRW
jgi:hypothetical protein